MVTPRTGPSPLDRFAVVRTDDVDDMREVISRFYGDVTLTVGPDHGGFRARGNHCQLNVIGMSYASYGATVHHHYPSLSSHYTVPLAASGTGRASVAGRSGEVNRHRTMVGTPGLPGEFHVGPDFEEVSVQMDATVVQRTLGALIGIEVTTPIAFEGFVELDKPENQLWLRLLRFLMTEAEAYETAVPVGALAEIEQALVVMFLKANRHAFSDRLNGNQPDAAPRQVRMAEDYIEAHWSQPITVEALTELTGVSARTIFDSFRKSRGYSPMEFVRRVRLRHARQMLARPTPGTTVAKVAFSCGFGNLGNFAKYYADMYGELPSQTLKASPTASATARMP